MIKRDIIAKSINSHGPQQISSSGSLEPDEIKHYFNAYLGRDPQTGDNGTINEYRIYTKHPDNKQMIRDLTIMRKNTQNHQGQGGPMDMGTFQSELSKGVANIMGGTPNNRMMAKFPSLSHTSQAGYRTDRNNNPTAMTTDVAKQAGLVPGVDYVSGDPFTGNDGRTYYTAKLLGDPVSTTIKAIDKGGFYTPNGAPRWNYLNSISGVQNWSNLNYNQKAQVVGQMYQHEGGNGQLVTQNQQQANPINQLSNLGNLTSTFGEKTPDTDFHRGVDIANAKGTPIPKLVPVPGQVSYVGKNGDYGNEIKVANADGSTETYGHLSVTQAQPGQIVQPGDTLGLMGSTGNSWSPSGGDPSHLHYEISDAYNRLVNPIDYLNNNNAG